MNKKQSKLIIIRVIRLNLLNLMISPGSLLFKTALQNHLEFPGIQKVLARILALRLQYMLVR